MQIKEMVANEAWKPIKGYESIYEVSNLGRIKSLQREINCVGSYSGKVTVKEKILKPYLNKKGYLRLSISDGLKRKSYQVHGLVAEAFIVNTNNKPQVNHINSIKNDNRVENLEWVNNSENIQHAYDNNKISRPMSKKVLNTQTGKKYKTITEASFDSGYASNYLSMMLNNKRFNRTPFVFY